MKLFPPSWLRSNRLPRTRRLATLRRSLRLLWSFPQEQKAPDSFYSGLALDTAQQISALWADTHDGKSLSGTQILDVGGGPGYFASAFAAHGAHYLSLEPSAGEMHAADIELDSAVRGDGQSLPFRNNSFDVVYSSNVAEHVPEPWKMAEEMLRVTRPGGLMILSYTIWLGPFGGHETGLWQHYVGGEFARDQYTKKHGRPPKNVFGESLFEVSCHEGLTWAKEAEKTHLEGYFPRYHPRWAWWLVDVPLVREFLVSNLVVVLSKTS